MLYTYNHCLADVDRLHVMCGMGYETALCVQNINILPPFHNFRMVESYLKKNRYYTILISHWVNVLRKNIYFYMIILSKTGNTFQWNNFFYIALGQYHVSNDTL